MQTGECPLHAAAVVVAALAIATIAAGACAHGRTTAAHYATAVLPTAPPAPLRNGFRPWRLAPDDAAVLAAPGSPVRTIFIRNYGPDTVRAIWQRNDNLPQSCQLAPGASVGLRATHASLHLPPGATGHVAGIYRIETERP